MKIKLLYIIIICWSCITCLWAQDQVLSSPDSDSIAYNSFGTNFELREYVDAELDKYRVLDEYNYGTNPKSETSLWQKLLMMLRDWLQPDENSTGLVWKGVTILFYLFIGIGGCWIVYLFLQGNYQELFLKSEEQDPIELSEVDENVDEQTLQSMLDKAVENEEFRVSIRILYLIALRQMDDKQLIQWKLGKTNFDYYNELKSLELKEQFFALTNTYEYIWYGDFELDNKEEFTSYESSFNSFFDELKAIRG